MKIPLILATLVALALHGPASRAEDDSGLAPSRVGGPEPSRETLKKEKPNRADGAGDKTARSESRTKPSRSTGPEKSNQEKAPRSERSGKRTWLGISTHPIDPSLGEHLELPAGFGIQVIEVMTDSPAGQAGLRRNDILLRFEDQRLISPEHLSLLVRTKKSGEIVAITLIRKGAEQTVEVPLGEADESVFGSFDGSTRHPHNYPMPPPFGQDPSQWQQQIRRQQDEILRQQMEWSERQHQERQRENRAPLGSESRPPSDHDAPGLPLRVPGTSGVLNIDNDHGELTLTRKDDEHHLVIRNAEGKEVYEGPFDPVKGIEALPEKAREQLKVMKLDTLEIRLPKMPGSPPEKASEPNSEPKTEKPSVPEPGIL